MLPRESFRAVIGLCGVVALFYAATATAAEPAVTFKPEEGRVQIAVDDKRFATYVYRDDQILRPYFTDVHAPGEVRTTRHHPPREGVDPRDHATMHPGIWLAFGDLSGHDFWRNKARVEHVEFVEPPMGGAGEGHFVVRNRYVDGDETVCTEVCRHTVLVTAEGYLLVYDSHFSGEKPFYFGDQEEMGLGVRLRTELRVKGGQGRLLNSDGGLNEAGVWGSQANWCDYSGPVEGKHAGLLLMPSPQNFGRCWFHARDYGFVAANPFGRNAFTRGEKSRIVVEPGSTLRLRFGISVHATPEDQPVDPAKAYGEFVRWDAAQ